MIVRSSMIKGSFLVAKHDVDQIKKHLNLRYATLTPIEVSNELLAADIFFTTDDKYHVKHYPYYDALYIPRDFTPQDINHAIIKTVAQAVGSQKDKEYINAFVRYLSPYVSDSIYRHKNDVYVTTVVNKLGQLSYQPTMINGLQLFKSDTFIFSHYVDAKNWFLPDSNIMYHLDEEEHASVYSKLIKSEHVYTISDFLKPRLLTSKRQAIRIAKNAERKFIKSLSETFKEIPMAKKYAER